MFFPPTISVPGTLSNVNCLTSVTCYFVHNSFLSAVGRFIIVVYRVYTWCTWEAIFVPATPNLKIQKDYSKIIQKHKIDIKVVEKAGKQLKTTLQTSDPFKQSKYQDEECFPTKMLSNVYMADLETLTRSEITKHLNLSSIKKSEITLINMFFDIQNKILVRLQYGKNCVYTMIFLF